ncbi:MAG: hypothetical protein ACOYWZ_01660 [Bacillota bacterium]
MGDSVTPLSVIYYIKNNTKKVVPIFISITFGVGLIYFLSMLAEQVNNSRYERDVYPLKCYAGITPMNEEISDKTLDGIKNNINTDRVIPSRRSSTRVSTIIGPSSADIIYLRDNDMDLMMDTLKLKLKEGRKPINGSDEIILHCKVAANKGLRIGDKIGSRIKEDEAIKGAYTLVGTMDGPSQVGIALLEDNGIEYEKLIKQGLIIIPKEGRRFDLNEYLDTLKKLMHISSSI